VMAERIQRFGARGRVAAVSQMVIVESLPIGDRRTGRELHDDLQTRLLPYGLRIQLHHETAASTSEFEFLLRDLWAFVNIDHRAPVLHIECHGDRNGLQFADGSVMDWSQLKPLLSGINYACRMNLIVVLACCDGAYFMAECRYTELVPFAWLLGPSGTVRPGALYSLMTNFWTHAFRNRDVTNALTVAGNAAPDFPFASFSAVGIFRLALAARLRNRIAAGAMDLSDEEQMFDRLRRIFFGLDDFPDNEERFSVTYAEVLAQVRAEAK
jgi:hypothetical protein